MIDYVYFRCGEGDWEGFYVNGELVDENHSIDIVDILTTYFGVTFICDNDLAAGEYLEKFGGRCPRTTNELYRVLGGGE